MVQTNPTWAQDDTDQDKLYVRVCVLVRKQETCEYSEKETK